MARCACPPPPGCLSLPSMSPELYLTSIIVPSHHIQVSGCASQLNPGPFSTPSRSRDLCLSSIQAPRFTSPLHPSWVSPQSRSLYTHLAYIQVTSNLHPGLPNCILAPSKHHLKCIRVSRCVSHLHPGHFSTGELYLSSIPVPYHPILVSRCASQPNPGPISTPSRSRVLCLLSAQAPRFTFLLCLSWILPQYCSWYLYLTYFQVTSHLHLRSTKLHLSSTQASSQTHTGFKMCVSLPSGSFLNWRIVSQLHPSPISPFLRLKMCISTHSRSHLNPIQVSRFVSPLKLGSQIGVSSLSQLNLTSIWVLIFASRLHPGNISPPASSTKMHLSSI